MSREKLKAAIKKAYGNGYHDGFNDACDTMMLHLHRQIVDYLVDMKKSAKEYEVEAIDEYEEEE